MLIVMGRRGDRFLRMTAAGLSRGYGSQCRGISAKVDWGGERGPIAISLRRPAKVGISDRREFSQDLEDATARSTGGVRTIPVRVALTWEVANRSWSRRSRRSVWVEYA
jgi:hypothetical protein